MLKIFSIEKRVGIGRVLIPFLMLILSSILVSADTTYSEAGNFNNHYSQGIGFFNDALDLDDVESNSFPLTNPKQIPLVDDLDNDGKNEIVVLSDVNSITLFEDKELNTIDGVSIPINYPHLSPPTYSNMIVFDWDGDDNKEILIADERNEDLYIFEYNGTNFYEEFSFNLSSLPEHLSDGEFWIKCGDVDDCVIAWTKSRVGPQTPLGPSFYIYIASFDTGSISNSLQVDGGSASYGFCFPHIRSMAYADYDSHTFDGDTEYIFSAIQNNRASPLDDDVFIYYIDATTDPPTLEMKITDTGSGRISPDGDNYNCDDDIRIDPTIVGEATLSRALTSPLVFNANGLTGDGLETIIGYRTDDYTNPNEFEFKMSSYKADGTFIKNHPDTFLADGIILSPITKMDAFTDTKINDDQWDFCLLGYNSFIEKEIDLLCSSLETTQQDDREFIIGVPDIFTYNVSYDSLLYNNHIVSAQHSSDTQTFQGDSNNPNEIISPFGVLRLDWENECRSQFPFPSVRCLELIYDLPDEDLSVVSVDYEQVGREDLIGLTDDSIFYIDDGFTNNPGQIVFVEINPCIDATIKVNSSVQIKVQVNDTDNPAIDDTQSRVILYQGDTNEQDTGWSVNVTSGTILTYSSPELEFNETISVGNIRILGRDAENLNEIDQIDKPFSVGTNGVEFGDCVSTFTFEVTPEDEDDGVIPDVSDDPIFTALSTISNLTGSSLLILWIVIMIAAAWGVWEYKGMNHPVQAFGMIVFIELLLLILGTLLTIIPTGIIITITIICIVIIGMWLRNIFTGTQNGGA